VLYHEGVYEPQGSDSRIITLTSESGQKVSILCSPSIFAPTTSIQALQLEEWYGFVFRRSDDTIKIVING